MFPLLSCKFEQLQVLRILNIGVCTTVTQEMRSHIWGRVYYISLKTAAKQLLRVTKNYSTATIKGYPLFPIPAFHCFFLPQVIFQDVFFFWSIDRMNYVLRNMQKVKTKHLNPVITLQVLIGLAHSTTSSAHMTNMSVDGKILHTS